MPRHKMTVILLVSVFLLMAGAADRRPIALEDILAWKAITAAELSPDGRWLGYRVSPVEGDSEVVIRETHGQQEYRHSVGEWSSPTGEAVEFSKDSGWALVTLAPSRSDAARLKKQKKPLENAVVLLELSSGATTEVASVKRAAFAGERAGWVALHRYPADAVGGKEKPKGSDLLLRDLATGSVLTVGNVSEFAFDRSGRYLAWTVDTLDSAGNGLQLRDLETGVTTALDSAKASFERPTWTDKGDGLAVLRGVENKDYKDRLYSVVGFTGLGGAPIRTVFDPSDSKEFPAGMTVSPKRSPRWTEDLSALLFGIHEPAKKEPGAPDATAGQAGSETKASEATDATDEETPDLVLWHWLDPRLQSRQQVQAERDRDFSYLSMYRVGSHTFMRLADDQVRDVTAAPHDRWAIGRDNRAYELEGNLDGRVYEDVYAIDMQTGARRRILERSRWDYEASPDGTRFLYYADGNFHAYSMTTGSSRNLTAAAPVSFVDTEDDHNVANPPVRPVGWAADGRSVLLSDNYDVWQVPVDGGAIVNLTANGRREGIRYRRRFVLDPDEKGIDLSRPQYFEAYGEWTKKGGIVRLSPGRAGVERLVWEDAVFSRLLKAEKADVFAYTRETNEDAPDFHVTDTGFSADSTITDVDPQQKDFLWSSGSMLVDYKSVKGDRLQAALFLPANYEKGKSYPTIVYIYERLSQGLNAYTRPTANGFNKSVYTSNGYAVLMPDITYRVNDPGMSAVWCVLPALKAAIATGVVDPAHVGLHGHSWGGYQTAFLVTQTDLFAAAVAGAPLTDMISMYSLIYKNSGGTNQAIFESSQGRFKGGYWDNWEAYVRNSPIAFAKNATTPLMILHNDKDGAVDFTQGVEYFNTLRRLKKPVVMLEYTGENHGLRKPANQKDYTVRMKAFFDHYLKGAPAPDWLAEGVPYLKMEERLKQQTGKGEAKEKTTGGDGR
jgi:dipeptidyl aminopeptidase/acylaminoacyl peptidase